jgi:hypothetical protein
VGSVSDSITVTVVSADDKLTFPLTNGEGPYAPEIDPNNDLNNYSLVVIINANPPGSTEPSFKLREEGAIKFEQILDGGYFPGISVRVDENEDPELNKYFRIENDKSGVPAIIYNYYPEDLDLWYAEMKGPTGIYVDLILSKEGYYDAKIKAHLLYNGSLFTGGGSGGKHVGQ